MSRSLIRPSRCRLLTSFIATLMMVGLAVSFQVNVLHPHQLPFKQLQHHHQQQQQSLCGRDSSCAHHISLVLAGRTRNENCEESLGNEEQQRKLSWRSRIFRRPRASSSPSQHRVVSFKSRVLKPLKSLRKALVGCKWARAATAAAIIGGSVLTWYPNQALASAPVMAIPKADARNPVTDAMMDHQRRMVAQAQAELRKVAAEARKIEAEKGEAARIEFERNYKQQQEEQAQQKLQASEQLKRDLLDQGIDPFCDLEGRRQMILQQQGLDLAKIPGTPYSMEQELQRRNSPQSFAAKHAIQRQIIKSMVQDLKNRQKDPLEYFTQHQDQTVSILKMPTPKAMALLQQYQANLELYGQVVPPKEGELSVLELKQKEQERLEAEQADPAVLKQRKREAQRLAKEAAAAERAARQLQQQQERAKAKAEAQAAKDQAKLEREQAKAAAKAAAVAASAAAATTAASATTAAVASAEAAVQEALTSSGVTSSTSALEVVVTETEHVVEDSGDTNENVAVESTSEPVQLSLAPAKTNQIPVAKVSVGVIAVAGGAYGLQFYREKAARDEEERQRQFRLLMGWDQDDKKKMSESSKSALDSELTLEDSPPAKETEEKPSVQVDGDSVATMKEIGSTNLEPDVSKKRKSGIKSVFSKRKANRETDLSALVRDDAKAPEFALLLAKILTAGAPGRFPHVVSLPGVSVSPTLDLESAKLQLIESRTAAGLTLEESAEIFANVVNCMLIDIVDLASTSLKEKEQKATIEAIRIVIDFMNYAASLYDSVAEGITITPVTYSGTISKSKLEQMYSAYAASGMMDMSQLDDFGDRVRLLQDVFQINEKKAEGLVMKAMQKNIVEMVKTGEGMEKMEAMMGGVGDMAGLMGGVNGSGAEAPNPEQLKDMLLALKQLKESGSIPPEELVLVKSQFREAFGSSIDEVMRQADVTRAGMTSSEQELLELMKAILNE